MESQKLAEILLASGCVEESEETQLRLQALETLEQLFRSWLINTFPDKFIKESKPQPSFKLLTIGSYELGIQSPGGDIDVLIIVTNHVSKEDLYRSFFPTLRDFCQNEKFCRLIEKTYVPVIKAAILNVDIDIAFTRFSKPELPANFLDFLDDSCLKGMDLDSVRSYNGWRDVIEIKNFVGTPDLEKYKRLLQFFKLWATRRGIYNNSVGYFSGMALMVLLAKFLKESPSGATVMELLQGFFQKYSKWPWPRPAFLRNCANASDAPVLQTWNAEMYSFDKENRMVILTPAYPQRNSSFTASISTRTVIVNEFKRACAIMSEKHAGSLKMLLEPPDFFSPCQFRTKTYIILTTESSGTMLLDHLDWCSIARSQIRRLVSGLEVEEHVDLVHPCANSFPSIKASHFQAGHYENLWVLSVDHQCLQGLQSLSDRYIHEFKDNVMKYAIDHGVATTGKTVSGYITPAKGLLSHLPPEIEHGVKDFTRLTEYKKGFFYYPNTR